MTRPGSEVFLRKAFPPLGCIWSWWKLEQMSTGWHLAWRMGQQLHQRGAAVSHKHGEAHPQASRASVLCPSTREVAPRTFSAPQRCVSSGVPLGPAGSGSGLKKPLK